MKKIFFVFLMFVFALNTHAQVIVKPNGGRIVLGPSLPTQPDDRDPSFKVIVLGPYEGRTCPGGKIVFGDYSLSGGMNVFMGEYGTTDTDQLWLHGKSGIYMTYGGYAENIVAYYDPAVGNKFSFNCDIYSQGIKLTSDEKFKTNINKLANPLSQLKKLNGVSYNYNFPDVKSSQLSVNMINSSQATDLTDKEKESIAFFEEFEKQKKNSKKKIGLIAQDLQKVFPELVEEDSSGYLYVDYIGLIPVIIEALKEQQTQIEEQKELIDRLLSLTGKEKLMKEDLFFSDDIKNVPVLMQNSPNPFNQATEISYYIPESVQNASLYIYDINGFPKKQIVISERAKGNTVLQASSFNAGLYFYTLICDGEPVDTKQMVLTK